MTKKKETTSEKKSLQVVEDTPLVLEKEEGEGEEEQEGKAGIPELLRYIFEPDNNRLPELTDIPLNQVNPLTWMATYEHATEDLVRRINFVGKGTQYRPILLSSIWRLFYYKHRRSLEGAGLFRAAQLANKQMETQEMQGEPRDVMDYTQR